MTVKSGRIITGQHVFWALFAFFAFVAVINIVMVYLGSNSWTGLTAEHSYEEGLRYNETIRQAEHQSALGWRSEFVFQSEGSNKGLLIVTLTDDRGGGIDNLKVEGRAMRPTSEGADRDLAFRPLGQGRYACDLDLPLSGQWDIRLRAAGASEIYRVRHRLQIN